MTSQPGSAPDSASTVAGIIERHQDREGALLPVLHDVQDRFGHIPPEVLPQIADALGMSTAEIHGVVTFYHDFRRAPAGRHVVKICRAEACQAVGADQLAALVRDRLGLGWHDTSRDGRITLEPVFCLGLCACGPAAMVDGRLVARLDRDKLDRLLEGLA